MTSKKPIVCTRCHDPKPSSDFSPGKKICKLCHSSEAKQRNRKNPKYDKVRQSRNLSKYGITVEEYEELLKKQKGGCAICGAKTSDDRVYSIRTSRRLCVDHDHILDINRGLLCTRCNMALGLFKEDPNLFLRAVNYLRLHQARRITRDQMFSDIAHTISARGTCPRAKVGAVIVRDSRIIATGYNGSLPGEVHCEDEGCIIEDNHCIRVLHAEQNAIIWAARKGLSTDGAIIYVTYPVCHRCRGLIAAAGIIKIKEV
jgi:dCMP deaminase